MTASPIDRDEEYEQRPALQPLSSLLLILVGLLFGFGVGSRIGMADASPDRLETGASLSAPAPPSLGRLLDVPAAAIPAIPDAASRVGKGHASGDVAHLPLATLEPVPADAGPLEFVEFVPADQPIAEHDNESAAEYQLASVDPMAALPVHQTIERREALQMAGNPNYGLTEYPSDHYENLDLPHLPAVRPAPMEHAVIDVVSPPGSLTRVTEGQIGAGQSLGSALNAQGISPQIVHLIATEMRKVFDFRRSRPRDQYRLTLDSDGRLLDFRYSQNADSSYYLAWEGTRYVVHQENAELRPQIAKIAGIVDSSFYSAVRALGEQSALAGEFARILAWDIDFSRNVHPGDEFQILYERLYRETPDGDLEYVRPGRVLAGRYDGRVGNHTVVYFQDENGDGAYFRPDGTSIERAFLAAPLEFSRISSRFTGARAHPILKVTRPHRGIDYAAPKGTPIWAVADGVVEYRARAGASGNLVRIRHAGGYTSHYAHLSKFAAGLSVGDRIDQKQIIGYVGSTGLSTGPHVCFRVKKDGDYVDPLKISSPAGEPVEPEQLALFHSVRDQLLTDLGPGPLAFADEAL